MSIFNRFSKPTSETTSPSDTQDTMAQDDETQDETQAETKEPEWAAPIKALAEGQSRLTQMMEAMAERDTHGQAAPPPPEPPIEDVNVAEINDMIARGEGDVGTLIKKAVNAGVERFRREHFAPFQQQGLAAVGDLSTTIARQQMPLYQEDAAIRKEVDTEIAKLPAELRTNAQAHLAIYRVVVGANIDRIVAAKVEAAQRREDLDETVSTPGRAGRSTGQVRTEATGREVPQARDLGGEQAEQALRSTGRTQDDLAKKLGYKDWGEYMEKAAELGYFGPTEQA